MAHAWGRGLARCFTSTIQENYFAETFQCTRFIDGTLVNRVRRRGRDALLAARRFLAGGSPNHRATYRATEGKSPAESQLDFDG